MIINAFMVMAMLMLTAANSFKFVNAAACNTFDEWIALGNVTKIDCVGEQSTTIPSQIGSLTNLRTLQLQQGIGVVGSFPSTMALLTNLEDLFAKGNAITGVMPDLSALTKLTRLVLVDLPLNPGPMPDFSAATDLEVIRLQNVKLTKTLPQNLEALTKVHKFNVEYNNLSGTIPNSLAALPNIEMFYAGHNSLSGTLPIALVQSKLTLLDIFGNQLSGSIQSYPFNDVTYKTLFINGNRLVGSPANIGMTADAISIEPMLAEAPIDFIFDGESCASNTTMCSSGVSSCGDVSKNCCGAIYLPESNFRSACESGNCEAGTGACLASELVLTINSTQIPTETPTSYLIGRNYATGTPTSLPKGNVPFTVILAVGIGAGAVFLLVAVLVGVRGSSPPPQQRDNFRGGAQEQRNDPNRRRNKWFQGSMRQPFLFSARSVPRMPWSSTSHPTTDHPFQMSSATGSMDPTGSVYKSSFRTENPEFDAAIRARGISQMRSSSVTVQALNDDEGVYGGEEKGSLNQRRKPSKPPRRSFMESFGASRANITSSIRGVWLNGIQSRSTRQKSFGAL